IIKVAVPAPQHSPILGQLPLSQIVCNLWVSTNSRTLAYSFPTGSFTLSQFGFFLLVASSDITGNSIISTFLLPTKIHFLPRNSQSSLFPKTVEEGKVGRLEDLPVFGRGHQDNLLCETLQQVAEFQSRHIRPENPEFKSKGNFGMSSNGQFRLVYAFKTPPRAHNISHALVDFGIILFPHRLCPGD